jgi:hypothetical protein
VRICVYGLDNAPDFFLAATVPGGVYAPGREWVPPPGRPRALLEDATPRSGLGCPLICHDEPVRSISARTVMSSSETSIFRLASLAGIKIDLAMPVEKLAELGKRRPCDIDLHLTVS